METTPSFDIEQENKLILKEYRALLRLLKIIFPNMTRKISVKLLN
jgi:hypothetical protein